MSSLFANIVKGVLIGGGTILSLLCHPVGGVVMTAGMAIGAGMTAAGGLIKTNDKVVSTVNSSLSSSGLKDSASPIATSYGSGTGFVLTTPVIVLILAVLALLIFKKR
jgi:hypothetical protein